MKSLYFLQYSKDTELSRAKRLRFFPTASHIDFKIPIVLSFRLSLIRE